MISAGQTKATDIGVGRQILCKEKPNTKPTSACAKKLTKTVKAAKKGLTAKQQKLWQKYVYTPAVLNVERYCKKSATQPPRCKPWDVACLKRLPAVRYKQCTVRVLNNKEQFKGLFGKEFKWSDYLINGAKMIKKLPPNPPNPWEL